MLPRAVLICYCLLRLRCFVTRCCQCRPSRYLLPPLCSDFVPYAIYVTCICRSDYRFTRSVVVPLLFRLLLRCPTLLLFDRCYFTINANVVITVTHLRIRSTVTLPYRFGAILPRSSDRATCVLVPFVCFRCSIHTTRPCYYAFYARCLPFTGYRVYAAPRYFITTAHCRCAPLRAARYAATPLLHCRRFCLPVCVTTLRARAGVTVYCLLRNRVATVLLQIIACRYAPSASLLPLFSCPLFRALIDDRFRCAIFAAAVVALTLRYTVARGAVVRYGYSVLIV